MTIKVFIFNVLQLNKIFIVVHCRVCKVRRDWRNYMCLIGKCIYWVCMCINMIVSSRICLIGAIWNKGVFIFRALWENGCRWDSGDRPVHILPISSPQTSYLDKIHSLLAAQPTQHMCTPPLPARVRLCHKDVPWWACKRYLCVRCSVCVCVVKVCVEWVGKGQSSVGTVQYFKAAKNITSAESDPHTFLSLSFTLTFHSALYLLHWTLQPSVA